jgi:tetratricopeptide (TPR) repeat protein
VKWLGGLAFCAALFASGAQADNAAQLYAAGKYQQAEAAGATENNAEGLTYAARAILAHETMGAPCLDCLKRAEGYARRAVAADPNYPDAHTYLAATLGYQGRIVGLVQARIDNYPEEAKENIDAALKADPNNGRALAALGGWNIEVVRAGGDTMAKMIYGASLEAGQHDFERAFAASPDNLVLRYQYALVLGGYGPERFRDTILDALKHAIAGKAATTFDAFEQNRARELLDVFKRGDMDAFSKLVKRNQGYPD